MEAAAEEPHKLFSNELVLDLILSFLDGESQLTARLVCWKWNDRILASFHKKLGLRLKRTYLEIPSKLKGFDRRIFSSLVIREAVNFVGFKEDEDAEDEEAVDANKENEKDKADPEAARKLFKIFLNFLSSSGGIEGQGRLRSLHLVDLYPKGLKYLIRLANNGLFQNLEDFLFRAKFSGTKEEELNYCSTLVATNAFPKLKKLVLLHDLPQDDMDEEGAASFFASSLPKVFQSFLDAAPNVVVLQVGTEYDLSRLPKLRELKAPDDLNYLFFEASFVNLLKSASNRLTSLEIQLNETSFNALPHFPKLTTLKLSGTVDDDKNADFRVNWALVPNLSVLQYTCKYEEGGVVRLLCPLPENVMEFRIQELPFNTDNEKKINALFNLILNIKVPRLIVELKDAVGISVILKIIDRPEVEVNVKEQISSEEKKQTILEFQNGCGQVGEVEPVRNFGAVVGKLRKRWDHIRFRDFAFQITEKLIYVPPSVSAPSALSFRINFGA